MASAQRPRVLVAEDEFFIAMDLAHDLQAMGAEVVAVEGRLVEVQAAIRQAGHLDVAVLDIRLDELVYPVADELMARGVPMVFVTGYDGSVIPTKYVHIPRCLKPVDFTQLAEMVRQAASRHLAL